MVNKKLNTFSHNPYKKLNRSPDIKVIRNESLFSVVFSNIIIPCLLLKGRTKVVGKSLLKRENLLAGLDLYMYEGRRKDSLAAAPLLRSQLQPIDIGHAIQVSVQYCSIFAAAISVVYYNVFP